MRLLRGLPVPPAALAVLPAAYHPPTRAHAELLRAGLARCGAALAVLPASLPHKDYSGVGIEARANLVLAAFPGCGVAITQGGLFWEIGRELREHYPGIRPLFLCGRDAAERVLRWDYGVLPPIAEQLNEFGLLVAARQGELAAPPGMEHAVERIGPSGGWPEVSSTEVRRRILAGEDWRSLAAPGIEELIREYYS